MATINITMNKILSDYPDDPAWAIRAAVSTWDLDPFTEGNSVPVTTDNLIERMLILLKHFVGRALEEERKPVIMGIPDTDAPIAAKWREPENLGAGDIPVSPEIAEALKKVIAEGGAIVSKPRTIPITGGGPLDELEEVLGDAAHHLLHATDIVHMPSTESPRRMYITTSGLLSLIRREFSAKTEPDPALSALVLLETRVRMLLYDRRLRQERDNRLRAEMLALAGTISAKAGEIGEARALLDRAEKLLKGVRE